MTINAESQSTEISVLPFHVFAALVKFQKMVSNLKTNPRKEFGSADIKWKGSKLGLLCCPKSVTHFPQSRRSPKFWCVAAANLVCHWRRPSFHWCCSKQTSKTKEFQDMLPLVTNEGFQACYCYNSDYSSVTDQHKTLLQLSQCSCIPEFWDKKNFCGCLIRCLSRLYIHCLSGLSTYPKFRARISTEFL